MPLPEINIVLDIDETIAVGLDFEDYSDASLEKLHYFLGSCISINDLQVTYVLYPGLIELLQLLDKMPNVRLSFFSAGSKDRNDLLVEKILIIALGAKRYNEVKSNITICSKDDLESLNGRQVKNLTSVLQDDKTLAWTVLIDDDMSRVRSDQIGNLLRVSGNFVGSFEDIGLPFNDFLNPNLNQIFYATGLLFTALDILKKNSAIGTLSDALLLLQYDDVSACQNPKTNPYWQMGINARKNKYYYDYGLIILKEMNKTLHFYIPLEPRKPTLSKDKVVETLDQHGMFGKVPTVKDSNQAIPDVLFPGSFF